MLTKEQKQAIDELKEPFKELGLDILLVDNGDFLITEHSPIRDEIHKSGWKTFFEQRAYMMEAFAYKEVGEIRVVTPSYKCDVKDKTKEELWRVV